MPGFWSRSVKAIPVFNVDDDGNPTSAGGGGGGSVPTGSAGSPNAAVVTVQGITGGVAQPVTGDVAAGSADTGAPQKIGGVASTTPPTAVANGQRVNAWYSQNGAAVVGGLSTNPADGGTNLASYISGVDGSLRPLHIYNSVYNGLQWDRMRGDTNGSYMVSKGSAGIATAQVSVGTTATQIVAARAGRGSVKITNLGTTDVFIGAAGVTSTTGDLLPGTKGASITIPSNAAIFGIAGTAQSVSVLEVF